MSEESQQSDTEQIWQLLNSVPDPEIPAVSVVELGIIADVSVEDGAACVKLTPSFAACPAIDHMRREIVQALNKAGFRKARVDVVFDPPWNTDRITSSGLEKLKAFGLALPRRLDSRDVEPDDLQQVACPFCDSQNTRLESSFGPTLCRAIHYCNQCRQSFEHFKPVS